MGKIVVYGTCTREHTCVKFESFVALKISVAIIGRLEERRSPFSGLK